MATITADHQTTEGNKPGFFDCVSCGMLHPANFYDGSSDGDCRNDQHRHTPDALDAKFGPGNWEHVSDPWLDDDLLVA